MQPSAPLSQLTTLAVGGPAPCLVRVTDRASLVEALGELRRAYPGVLPLVVGGGSNLLVADAGPGRPVVVPALVGWDVLPGPEGVVRLQVGAGVVWDDLVAYTVSKGWAGIECLSGIPGWVGAAPVQNIGAYGQEVDQVIERVYGVHLATGNPVEFTAAACGFGYRHSRFKAEDAGQYVITSVVFRLVPGGTPTLAYPELRRAAEAEGPPSLASVRALVLRLRRAKSMVYDPADANHRSAGSFFTNPLVSPELADAAEAVAQARGLAPMPRYPAAGGQVKLSAAWLIQRSGFPKGYGDGSVGLSTRHTLAVVNRGQATAAEVVAFAVHLQRGVREAFGVQLTPEPVWVGFERSWAQYLAEDASP